MKSIRFEAAQAGIALVTLLVLVLQLQMACPAVTLAA
jgi:hypothetical protein